jgi:hypothetical protein
MAKFTITVTEEDRKTADAALEFIRETLGTADPEALTDYCYNLLVAVKQGSVDSRLSGIVASAIPFYLREMGKLEEKKRVQEKPSEHFGQVGERVDFYATLTGVFPVESMYGTTFITKMVTREGNVVTWFASNDVTTEDPKEAAEQGLLCMGVESKLTGTIKKHDEFKGQKQTVVTRCTVWTAEGIRQAEEKAARKAAREAKKAAKK